MDEASFHRAIADAPEDDRPRLIYADWLEENGLQDRAEWIRVSCELARARGDYARWESLLRPERDAFRRCRPPWWEYITNLEQRNDRGLFRFVIGASRSSRSATTAKRLGKVPWLAQAGAGGWLQRIDVLWCDGELAAVLASWKGPVLQVPLFVRPAPQMDDEGLQVLLGLPQLQGLDLEPNVLRNPTVQELGKYANLCELNVSFRLVQADTADAVLDQIARMTGLRRLRIRGHNLLEYGNRPNDDDLRRLRGLTELRRLSLPDCPAVTDAGVAELRQALLSLVIDRN